MKFIQRDSSSIYYTQNRLKCFVCKKFFNFVIQTKNLKLFCWNCFYEKLPFLLEKTNNYIECRKIYDVLFNQRKETRKKERTLLTLKLRFSILKRDNFRCVICGKSAKDIKLEIDHIKPISKGGKTILTNLQTLCFNCNRGKSNI